jgi:spore coat polysaccharide biosynthesis protein SpsF (cytidylyltransferase family)
VRVVALVQARQGSSRLPGKSMRPLQGRPMIGHVLERARAIRGVDDVLLVTSTSALDSALIREAITLGCHFYTGSEWDVLGRMAEAARAVEADVVMRLTGDCPLLAPDVAEQVLAFHANDPVGAPYACNDTEASGFPDGTDVEVMTRAVLDEAAARAMDRRDREHVTPWIRRERTWATLRCDAGDFRALKLSVDREEDYERVRRVMAQLADPADFSFAATLAAARRAGELAE